MQCANSRVRYGPSVSPPPGGHVIAEHPLLKPGIFPPWHLTAASPPARPPELHSPGLLPAALMVPRPLRETDRAEFLRVVTLSREHLRPCTGLHREGEPDAEFFDRHLEMGADGDHRGTAWRRVGVL